MNGTEAQHTFFRDKREVLLNGLKQKSDEKRLYPTVQVYYSPALNGMNASFGQSSKKRSGLKV